MGRVDIVLFVSRDKHDVNKFINILSTSLIGVRNILQKVFIDKFLGSKKVK